MRVRQYRAATVCLLALFVLLVLRYTVLGRPAAVQSVQTEFLWSYRKWLQGSWAKGAEILANIALLMPFGFLLSALTPRRAAWKSLLAGLLLSGVIELLQLRFMRGVFEFDDLFNNSLGAVLGSLACMWLRRRLNGQTLGRAVLAFGAVAVLVAAVVSLSGGDEEEETDTTSRRYCFQVDSVSVLDGRTELRGFALHFGRDAAPIRLYLKAESDGRLIPLDTQSGIERADVDAYFHCEYDYSRCGYVATASGLEPETEYEVYAQIGWPQPLPMGVWLKGLEIHDVPEADFRAPEAAGTDLPALLDSSRLRAYCPDIGCWIYQRGASLYYIADARFPFEADGSSYVHIQAWTTQASRLPEARREENALWGKLSGSFERFELAGDFGPYRVMRRELPGDYAVSSIVTGQRRDDAWLWKCIFRPYYSFS